MAASVTLDDLFPMGDEGDAPEVEPNAKALVPVPVSVSGVPAEADDVHLPPTETWPVVHNVVCSFKMHQELDLKQIAFRIRNAEYNPRKCNSVIYRLRRPKVTAMIYQMGKVMITGAKTEEEARDACKKVTRMMQKIGFEKVIFADFHIENIVAKADLGFPVRLEQLAFEYRSYATYEPELFPGLIYRMFEPKMSILVFVSGKVTLTGAASVSQIGQAFNIIYPLLARFQT